MRDQHATHCSANLRYSTVYCSLCRGDFSNTPLNIGVNSFIVFCSSQQCFHFSIRSSHSRVIKRSRGSLLRFCCWCSSVVGGAIELDQSQQAEQERVYASWTEHCHNWSPDNFEHFGLFDCTNSSPTTIRQTNHGQLRPRHVR
jgi:hypothetical protein